MYTGKEKLEFKGKELPFTIQNYWQINLSQLLLNVTRGGFAEYIVLCALSKVMGDALQQCKTGMEAWDIDGPEIILPGGTTRRSRIEVKSAASVQIDTPDEKEPISLPASHLTFSIRRAIDFSSNDTEAHHNNDLYVFAHYKATRKAENILDLDLWEFYVYPTYLIEENPSLAKQKTISVRRLQLLGVEPQRFDTLCDTIMNALEAISAHYASVT